MAAMETEREIQESFRVFCRLRPVAPAAEAGGGDAGNSEATVDSDMDAAVGAEPGVPSSSYAKAARDADRGGFAQAHEDGQVAFRCTRSQKLKEFGFTGTLCETATQEDTFSRVALPVVDAVCQGYNGAIMAYGQTGSGKTHSMRGPPEPLDGNHPDDPASGGTGEASGIVPRAIARMFHLLCPGGEEGATARLYFSYCQIYCEVIQDLLEPGSGALALRELDGQVSVEGLTEVPIQRPSDVLDLCQRGDANRTTACTRMNAHSSRSHAIVVLRVEQLDPKGSGTAAERICSTLFLVDLAGSERAKHVGQQYQRFEELKSINLSLSALGNCVSALASGRRHIPFRDAKLTRLLQQSLGGNARTSVLVCCRTDPDFRGESQSTLEFAARCMQVPVKAFVTRHVDYEHLWRSAQAALDKHAEEMAAMGARMHTLEEEHERAQQAASDSREEAHAWKVQLDAERRAATRKVGSPGVHAEDAGGAADANEAREGGQAGISDLRQTRTRMAEGFREEVDRLREEYRKSVVRVQDKYDRRIQAYKSTASSANAGWSSVEYDLMKERESHLDTLAQLRVANERARKAEVEVSGRLAIVLEELSQARDRVASAEADAVAAKESAVLDARENNELSDRLIALEAARTAETAALQREYVHQDKVEAMQQLFNETLVRLGARVEELETQLELGVANPRTVRSELPEAPQVQRQRLSQQSSSILEALDATMMKPPSRRSTPTVYPPRNSTPGDRVIAPGGSVRVIAGTGIASSQRDLRRSMSHGQRPSSRSFTGAR